MDFELSSEFSRIQAIPHFTIFAKKSESTRLWFQETLGTKATGYYKRVGKRRSWHGGFYRTMFGINSIYSLRTPNSTFFPSKCSKRAFLTECWPR